MARSKPSWVLSIRVTGRDQLRETALASNPWTHCGPHPWRSPRVSALRPGALARLVYELRARHLVRVGAHRRAALDEPAHLRAGCLEVLLEHRRRAALERRRVLEPAERRGRRDRRQLGHETPALVP